MTPVQLGANSDRLALAFFHALGLEQPFAWFWHPIVVPKSRRKCAASSEIHVCGSMLWIALWLLHSRCSLLQLHDLHATCISHEFEVQEGSIVFETIEQCSWPVLRMFLIILIIWGISKRNIANSESESSKLSPGWFPDIIARVAFFQNWNEWLDCNQLCQLKRIPWIGQ